MASLSSTSLSLPKNSQQLHPSSGVFLKPNACCVSVSFGLNRSNKLHISAPRNKRILTIQSAYRDDDGSGSTGLFVGGFILGGLIVGALGCVYAPQISKAIAGADRKDLMRKLPKFIYDEEKALEKTRKVLAEKIAQLNSAIDDVSSQLKSEDTPNGAALSTDEVEATA
ncbi:unnamed protein product [Arabidopsis lyrata]|uniref:Localized to the inner membrane of the chloroplast n=1 Tax=Arabidopsis lyrata subsp. lyrata TaxID=81972 RepID=D7KMU8_ARALL|nr:uncharacterized protein LOC9329998 [Arabidopsis lyrata subsp. lyrata]EFH67502.1 hypothetical protein ARALYDRAFT_473746 [Arabidopsis lyrata subsp. lyrata]CAH8254592.1 unnamed protein product [Arabidopsis lyrata]|eukprot:XP_020866941.1 uncharacterized protein LOC9329998 [Arabidopsis lyrata subsp. lyrata]